MRRMHSIEATRPRLRAAAFAAALIVCGAGPSSPVSAQTAPARVRVTTIEIAGNQRLSNETILRELGFAAGDTVGYESFNRAIKQLFATGQFEDVAIDALPDTTDAAALGVRVVVEERPVVASIEYEGLEHVRESNVRDTVDLRPGQPLDPGKLQAAEAVIRSMLAAKGYHAQHIGHRIEEIADRPEARRVVFEVREGERLAVADLQFEGNTVFTDGQLTSVIDTKPEGFLWFRGGRLDEERLRSDLREHLPSFYAANGFLDFTVVDDSLVVDEQTGKARLVVTVEEGPQYVLSEFEIVGNRVFPSDVLRAYFEQERGGLLRALGFGFGGERQDLGETFDAVAFQEATDQIRSLYRNQGYLYAQVVPVMEKLTATDSTTERPAVRAAWQITEGQPAFINEVRIVGNTYTHEDVIRGVISVIPGARYNEDDLLQSYQRISALGFFEPPEPPQIEETGDGDVNITFVVKEKQTGAVNFGATLGGVSGISGFLGYDQPNLFGRAKSGHLRWEFGQYSNNFEISYTDPAILGTRYSGSLGLFSSRDRFSPFRDGQRRRTGASTRFGLPLPTDMRNSRLTLGYSLSRTTYEEFDDDVSSIFSLPPGVQSTVTLGMTRTTVDHPTFPSVGTRQEVLAELSGGVLGGDGDFQKYTASSSWYAPVAALGGDQPGSRPIRLVLGLTAEAGALLGDASRFPFERFWMGGVQFGRPLRGYDETGVTPLGVFDENSRQISTDQRFGDAYLRLSADLSMRLTDQISLSTFYDAGNVWREPGQINPARLVRGAGFGVSLVTPFGPLGIDWAYGFDKPVPGWQLHFKFGQGF